MSIVTEVPPRHVGLVPRATALLLRPGAEWDRIAEEKDTAGAVFARYVAILAAVPPVCGAVGSVVFGRAAIGARLRTPVIDALAAAAVSYVLAMAGVFVLAGIIHGLAATFEGKPDRTRAFKVAAYAGTASWLAGVFGLVPQLALLGITGLYSLFLLYRGLPRLMRTPADKAAPYAVVIVLAAAALFVVAEALVAPILRFTEAYGGA